MSTKSNAGDTGNLEAYVREGERQAYELGNRGPIRFNDDGTLDQEIIDAYWRCGFYVLEGALSAEELNDLQEDMEDALARAPYTKDATVDAQGRPAIGSDLERPTFRFAKPLSDPYGGTELVSGRHPAKMSEPAPPADAPDYVINSIGSPLQIMDSCLRLYGHPQLLAIAASINGPDFTPFTESVIVKRAGLGPSVAWHHDGTTHWDSPDLDEGTHGFNFMAQLYGSTAENGVWLLPGSHKRGKFDIKAMVEEEWLRPAARGCADGLRARRRLHVEPAGPARFVRQHLAGPENHDQFRLSPPPLRSQRPYCARQPGGGLR